MAAAANTTTATAAAISPHGRDWVTTCVGGRVRPRPPLRGAGPFDVDTGRAPEPDRLDPPPARPASGLRSLATFSPQCWSSGASAGRGAAWVRSGAAGL